jgi:hypothetical protein
VALASRVRQNTSSCEDYAATGRKESYKKGDGRRRVVGQVACDSEMARHFCRPDATVSVDIGNEA